MKLSEIQLCGICNQPVDAVFYHVTVAQIMVDVTAARQVAGLLLLLGNSLALAEAMAPRADVTVTLQQTTKFVCLDCLARVTAADVLFTQDAAADEKK